MTKEEMKLTIKAIDRADKLLLIDQYFENPRFTLLMDLEVLTGAEIKRLMKFDDFSFAHDIVGIQANIDRNTGKLRNCFVPRCRR